MDLTIFLGKMDILGRHIYMSWQIMRSMFLSLAVFIPSLIAFASAFHCFLINNEIFEGPVASILKSFEMLLGEVDFADNFLYDNVEASEGADITNLVCGYFREDKDSEWKNAFEKVCITARPKKERDVTFGKHRFSKWILKHHNEQDTNVRTILVMETFQSTYENFWDNFIKHLYSELIL